eukprot:Skav235661  [mRNA]  locus=scaffold358:893663:897414:+ [translate_table: standard]
MKHRVLYAFKLFRHGHPDLWRLLCDNDARCSGAWTEALRHGICWLRTEQPNHPMMDSSLTHGDIKAWCQATTPRDATSLRQTMRRACLQEKTIHEVEAFYVKSFHLFKQSDIDIIQLSVQPDDLPPAAHHRCHLCPRGFQTIQALRAHQWRAHNCRAKERSYMDCPTCRACGLHFWTMQRLQQHVKRPQQRPDGGCYKLLATYLDPVHPEHILPPPPLPDAIACVDRLPAVLTCGPWKDMQTMPTAWERQNAAALMQLDEAWGQQGFPDALPDDLFQTIVLALTPTTRRWLDEEPADDSLAFQWMSILEDPQRTCLVKRRPRQIQLNAFLLESVRRQRPKLRAAIRFGNDGRMT